MENGTWLDKVLIGVFLVLLSVFGYVLLQGLWRLQAFVLPFGPSPS